jgi:hypothetical protein
MEPSLSPPPDNSTLQDSSPYSLPADSPADNPDLSPEEQAALEQAPETSSSEDGKYTAEVPNWSSLDDVAVDALPEHVRAYVAPLLTLARAKETAQQEALAAYQQSKTFFDQMIEQMDANGVADAKPIASQLEAQSQVLNQYAGQLAQSAWMAFEARNQHYNQLPPNTKEAFAKLLENPNFETTWDGKTYVEKLEDALRYAQYRTGVQVAPMAATVAAPTAQLPPLSPQPRDAGVARRQAAVASGETGGGLPVRAIDELSWDEVLGRHDHLLSR